MVNDRYRRGNATPRRSYHSRRRRHRLGAASADSGYRSVAPQFMRRVKNRPALRRRGRLRAIIRAVAVAGAVALVAYGSRLAVQRALTSPALSIQSVRLHQVPKMLIEPVLARLKPAYGQNVLAIDLVALRESLEELPAVRSAGIRRVLPDGLVVSVEPRQPRAHVEAGDNGYDIDAEGMVLDLVDPATPRLPRIVLSAADPLLSGPGMHLTADAAHGAEIRSALAVLDWLDASERALDRPVDHLRIDADGIVLVVPSGLEVILGDERRIDAKMEAVRDLLRADPPAGPAQIDARYADMLVVRRLDTGSE